MALIQLSGLVSDIQGRIAGTVFQKGQSGHIIRSSPRPINRNTELQQRVRNITYNLQNDWKQLTTAQRTEWDLWSKWLRVEQNNISGRFINGQQAYIRTNFYRHFYNEAILSNPVFQPYIHDPLTIYFEEIFGGLRCVIDDATLSITSYLILSMTIRVNESLNSAGNRLRLLNHTLTVGVTQFIRDAYTEIFGIALESGEFCFARWSIGDKTTGIIKPFQQQKFEIQ